MARYVSFLLFILLQFVRSADPGYWGEELPGHMMPLGSHRAPEMVRRISHLPSPLEFHENYVLPKIPVVIEGALNNSATWRKWQDDQYIR